jgi:hypothetical protein
MNLAIERVKQMVSPLDSLCAICHKNAVAYPEDEMIEIKDMPTEVGLPTCKTCFTNIQIMIGELSCEY